MSFDAEQSVEPDFPELSDLKNDFERAEYLQNTLTNHATNDGASNNKHYKTLRRYFLDNHNTKPLVPNWVRTKRDLSHFWQFIKNKFPTYAERREFIWGEFSPLLEYLEQGNKTPHKSSIEDSLDTLSSDYVNLIWQKSMQRIKNDPEGAITSARTLIEAVLKHILEELDINYPDNPDLHELYKIVAEELQLTPEQHEEKIFKQILGSCSGLIGGLGNLRNSLGDAHGKGSKSYSPGPRHAELAVNLSGSMCLFLVKTLKENIKK
ncbi:MAG: abortive infection family protein [Candidatus Paceibacterota bacterium]